MPASKLPPSRRPLSKNFRIVSRSAFVTGRRYASRAIRERIFVAQSVGTHLWSAAARHTKIARRLGVFVAVRLRAVRAADLHRAHRRIAHVDLIVGEHAAALQRLRKPFRLPQLAHERHADDARAGRHRHADLEARIAGQLHEGFPFGSAREPRLAVARIAGGGGSARRLAADRRIASAACHRGGHRAAAASPCPSGSPDTGGAGGP